MKLITAYRFLGLITMMCTSYCCFAQPVWVGKNEGSFINVEFMTPSTQNNNINLTFPSISTYVSGKIEVSQIIKLVAEIPILHAHHSMPYIHEYETSMVRFNNSPPYDIIIESIQQEKTYNSSTVIGNPYFGIEIKHGDSNFFWEIGWRPRVLSDSSPIAGYIGRISDSQRRGAGIYRSHVGIVRLNYLKEISQKSFIRIRLGPTLYEGGSVDVVPYFEYVLQFGQNHGSIGYLLGYIGEMNVREVNGNFTNVLAASLWKTFGKWQPGLQARLPMSRDDQPFKKLSNVVGLNLRYYITS